MEQEWSKHSNVGDRSFYDLGDKERGDAESNLRSEPGPPCLSSPQRGSTIAGLIDSPDTYCSRHCARDGTISRTERRCLTSRSLYFGGKYRDN